MYIGMTLTGGAELDKKLMALERKVGRKIVKKAVRAALKPELAGSKASAKSIVGGSMGSLIARNLQLRAFKKQKKGSYGMSVKTKPDIEEFVDNGAYIPAAIEYGHISPSGGMVAAMPFMRASADTWKSVGLRIVSEELKKGVEAAAHGG